MWVKTQSTGQMLNSSRKTHTDIPGKNVYQLLEHFLAQSSWHIKLIIIDVYVNIKLSKVLARILVHSVNYFSIIGVTFKDYWN